jgi:hypothetical protein
MNSGQARTLLAQAAVALTVSALIAGCGNNYRPVVTPVNPSGPAAQVTSYVVVVSSTGPSTAGVATIIDYSGDTIMADATIGVNPYAFTIDELASEGYTINSDGTLTNFPITTTLQAKNVLVSTLPSTAVPVNMMAPSSGLWAADLDGNVADVFSGSPQVFKLAIPLANTLPVSVFGPPTLTGQREYVLSQNVADAAPMTCNSSPRTAPLGSANPIEVASNTADPPIAVGHCPVYAVMSSDLRRFFVLNRGDDTVTVINAQNNTLDNQCPAPTGCVNQNGQTYFTHPVLPLSTSAVTSTGVTPPNGTAGMTATAGPVYAEYNSATQQLVIANYDGGTISVIDVSLDEYGNDSSTFGTTYTIPVGNTATPNPASVTVVADGSKAYTANQNDTASGSSNGTVTVVNLSTHQVEKTLTVTGHPRTVASTQNSEYSKIYVASPDSPDVTVIESTPTVTDQIDTNILVQGNVVDLRVTTQNGSSGNANYTSRVPGYGQPCNLPGASQTDTIADCRSIQ